MVVRFPHEEHGESQPEGDEGGAEQEGAGAQPVVGGNVAGGQCCCGDAEVSRGFVEAHGQSAPVRADEVHFHHHGGGPGQSLADAEDDVGCDDPSPGWSEDEQQGHGDGDQPAGDQHGFAPVPVGEGAGKVVGAGLGQTEGQDVGQRARVQIQMEHLVSQQWQDRALLAEGAADQSVDGNEQHELSEVLSQAQRDGSAGSFHRPVSRPRPVACIQSAGPPSRTATPVRPARCRMLAALMARSPCPHMTTSGPAGSSARWSASSPSSRFRAPTTWPAAYSEAWRMSTRAAEASVPETRRPASISDPVAAAAEFLHAGKPPSSSPARASKPTFAAAQTMSSGSWSGLRTMMTGRSESASQPSHVANTGRNAIDREPGMCPAAKSTGWRASTICAPCSWSSITWSTDNGRSAGVVPSRTGPCRLISPRWSKYGGVAAQTGQEHGDERVLVTGGQVGVGGFLRADAAGALGSGWGRTEGPRAVRGVDPVSYTHLTLPTILRV